jgi:hypothetical protein
VPALAQRVAHDRQKLGFPLPAVDLLRNSTMTDPNPRSAVISLRQHGVSRYRSRQNTTKAMMSLGRQVRFSRL